MDENEIRQQIRDYITKIIAMNYINQANKMLNENLPDAIKGKDKIRNTYNKAKYVDAMRIIRQWWADFLDTLKKN